MFNNIQSTMEIVVEEMNNKSVDVDTDVVDVDVDVDGFQNKFQHKHFV